MLPSLCLQCLTLENYDTVMYPLVAANNWGAAAYMLAWLVVGYFVILTLFMAIIMEAFESKYNAEASEEAFTACESCETCRSSAFVTQGKPCHEVHDTCCDACSELGKKSCEECGSHACKHG